MYEKDRKRLELAIARDANIATTRDKLSEYPGASPEYLNDLGLDRKCLRRLERLGLAFRAYTKNFYGFGDTFPGGQPVPGETFQAPVRVPVHAADARGYERVKHIVSYETRLIRPFRGKGHRVMWLLVNE